MKPFAPKSSSSVLTPMQLQGRTTRALVDQQGQRITCLEGLLWVTQHRDQRDIVLMPGDSFILDKPGLAIVFALRDSLLTVGSAASEDLAA